MPTVTEAGPVTRSVAPVFWSPWPRWDMRGSPTLPILLGFLGRALSTAGVGEGCRGCHSGLVCPYSLEAKAPEAGCACPYPVWCVSPCIAPWCIGLCCAQMRGSGKNASHSMWACANEQLVTDSAGGEKCSIFPAPKSENFIKKKNSHRKAVFWQGLLVRSLSSLSHRSLDGKFYS